MASNYSLGESGSSSLLPRRQISTINASKIGLESGIKSSLSLAAKGAQMAGPWGAAAGFAAGVGKGVVDYFKAKKEHLKETDENDEVYANSMTKFEDSSKGIMARDAAIEDEVTTKNVLMGKRGGSIDIMMDIVKSKRLERRADKENIEIKRSGGALNVIAKGVLHEDKNNIGDNGIPVVAKNKQKTKVAEIEKNELVFNHKISNRIEKLTKEHKKDPSNKEILRELGELMKMEITENTVDKQGELL